MAPIYLFPLIEIYCSPAVESCPHFARILDNNGVSGMIKVLQVLRNDELIERDPREPPEDGVERHGWVVTEKGKVYVNALQEVPLPVKEWSVRL